MKQAFKSILTINFTHNKNKLDYDAIKSYLQENNLSLNGIEFDDLINPFKNLIENLILKNLRDEEALRNFLEEYKFLDAQNITDIINVWNQEKTEVYSFVIKKGLPSKSLENLDWAINMQTYSRRAKNLKDLSFLFSLKLKDNTNEKVNYVNFEMNKAELSWFHGQLQEIETSIQDLFAKKK